MFETHLAVVGHIVNDLQRRKVGEQELIKFRLASNSRRRTADGSWEPGNSLFITVNCWGRLVAGVGATLGKGSPVIAVGDIYTSEYEDRDGNKRSSLEMRATAVGPDVSRVRVERPGQPGPGAEDGAAPVTSLSAPADTAAPAGSAAEGDADEPSALPLSA